MDPEDEQDDDDEREPEPDAAYWDAVDWWYDYQRDR